MRLVVALAFVSIAAIGCKKQPSSEPAPGSAAAPGSATAPGSAAAAPADATDVVAADATVEVDAAQSTDTATVTAGVATMSFGEQKVKVTLTLPEGWIQGKPQDMGGFIFTPADAKYERPNISVIALNGIGPAPKRIKEDFADAQKKVIGGGKLKVLRTADLPDGKLVSIHVDAKKERDIVYVETICFIGKADSKVMVRLNGFAEEKDAALVKTFEDACKTLSIVTP